MKQHLTKPAEPQCTFEEKRDDSDITDRCWLLRVCHNCGGCEIHCLRKMGCVRSPSLDGNSDNLS